MRRRYHAFMAIKYARWSRSWLWEAPIGSWRWRVASCLLIRAIVHSEASLPRYNPEDDYEQYGAHRPVPPKLPPPSPDWKYGDRS